MPAPTLLPDDQKNDSLNPSQRHADALADLAGAEKRGTADMSAFEDSFKNDTADGAEEDANVARAVEKLRNQESDAASGTPGTWAVNRSNSDKTEKRRWLTAKKGGTIGGITAILLGLLGIGTTLFTPGLGIVQMKEVLTKDLNDQLAAMDIRSGHVFNAKLSKMSSGICTGVKIQCKFKSMSKTQIDRFKKAGFIIPDEGVRDTLFGRKKITMMTAPDGTEIRNPADLATARKKSPQVRSAMNRVFNPIYYGLADKVASSVLQKNKTNKQKKVSGDNEEGRRNALMNATAGEKANGGVLEDSNGRYMIDEDGTRVYDSGDTADRFNELKGAADEKLSQLADKAQVGGKAVGGVLGGAFKGVSVIGAADSACTVYNTARAISAGAKIARAMQLIQFAMVINTTADSIKAGDATPEEVEFIGNMLTATDTNQKAYDDLTGEEVDNPFYGKSAFDSPGYKVAAYNEAPILTSRSQQYMIGGGLSGTFSSVLSTIESMVSPGSPENIRSVCKVTQSFWVRGAGLVVGIFAAVGSFGTSTVVSMVASLAVSLALPFLEAALADMMAGQVIGEDIKGVDAGDAAFAGSAAMFGSIAQNRGMTPLSKEGMQEYIAATSESRNEMIAAEKYEASKNPFDINSQYSFLGSFARILYPTSVKARSNVASAITSIGSILKLGLTSALQPDTAKADQEFNEARFSRCNDPGYRELGIDADVFCNVRYGLTASELAMDSEAVVDFMYGNGYIDEEGRPQGAYKDFMDKCANRTDGWGETSEENGSTGTECIDGRTDTFKDISYFRVFTIDNSINDAMDTDPNTVKSVGKFVLPLKPGYKVTAGFEMYNPFGTQARMHMGIDFATGTAAEGSPVYAVADGEVISRGTINNDVVIRHSNGLMSRYLHMYPKDVTLKVGDKVSAGQEIGKVGNYGESTGAHLHFEIDVDDQTDPEFISLGPENAATRGREARNPVVVMSMLGVDILNGTYTDGRS